MILNYPACFYPAEENEVGYTVEVPDLSGCISEGDTLTEAISMAIDAVSGWILDELEDGKPVPKASRAEEIVLECEDGFILFIPINLDFYITESKQ